MCLSFTIRHVNLENARNVFRAFWGATCSETGQLDLVEPHRSEKVQGALTAKSQACIVLVRHAIQHDWTSRAIPSVMLSLGNAAIMQLEFDCRCRNTVMYCLFIMGIDELPTPHTHKFARGARYFLCCRTVILPKSSLIYHVCNQQSMRCFFAVHNVRWNCMRKFLFNLCWSNQWFFYDLNIQNRPKKSSSNHHHYKWYKQICYSFFVLI